MKQNLSFFSFRFTCLHVIIVFAITVIAYKQNIICHAKYIWWIFKCFIDWNICPAWAVPNGNFLYLYLPNWHSNIVRYDDLPSNWRLWYPKIASVREKYFTLFNFGKILSVGSLWTGHISTWFSLAKSRQSLTFLLGLGTSIKLLDYSAVSCTPSGVIMPYCWSHSNSFLKGFCNT